VSLFHHIQREQWQIRLVKINIPLVIDLLEQIRLLSYQDYTAKAGGQYDYCIGAGLCQKWLTGQGTQLSGPTQDSDR
jgi:hypothetical protein